jgi:hypothetical protein
MLAVYRSATVSAAWGISEGMTVPAKLPDLSAEPRLSAPLATPRIATPRMAATQAELAEQAGLELARPVPPLGGGMSASRSGNDGIG